MIRYRLKCKRAHEFEAWFRSSAAYEAQAGAGQVMCPNCGSPDVVKAVMAPNVATRGEKKDSPSPELEKRARLLDVVRDARRTLMANAENVGAQFPEEARKIHYQEVEARRIYGEASGEEARALLDEGIEIIVLPPLLEDAN